MTMGVGALQSRLDADLPARLSGAIDWNNFLAWNGGTRPAFAGKYFVGSPWRWAHGEATSLIDPEVAGAILRIVPLQAADRIRQIEVGELGLRWGGEDGRAIGEAIANALVVGDLDLSADQPVPVYLEVADGTPLSSDYWTEWASAVRDAVIVGSVAGTGLVPLLRQPLLPCLFATFTASPNGWQPPPAVIAALESPTSEGAAAGRCHGFWARTTPDAAPLAPQPNPSWATFADYRQPQPAGPPTRVPVLIWRYATGNPAAPDHQVGRLTLETTRAGAGQPDPVLDGMLTAVAWRADDPDISPVAIGIDRGSSALGDIDCLLKHENQLTVRNLPEPTLDGKTVGRVLPSPLKATPSFVGRYYSQRPTNKGRNPKDLTVDEAVALSNRWLDVVMFFQSRTQEDLVAAHLAKRASGPDDGFAAGWFAASTMRQPPHTPIYFAVDCDVTTSGTSTFPAQGAITEQQLIDYFTGVNAGLASYLNQQPKSSRTPYAVGAYACRRAFDLLYPRGLASHFWQAFPPFWGDDVMGRNSNLTAWPHLNLWQVALSGNVAVQARIGVTNCQRTYRFEFTFNVVDATGLPQAIRVTKEEKVTSVPFPAHWSDVQKVTGGRVGVVSNDSGSVLGYRIELDKRPKIFSIEAVPPFDPGFTPRFRDLEGIADVDVAWGDTGGWRLARGGR
ncbi:glycoside hydrolase domain-containing protein [Streptomyces chartreusis]